MPSSLNSALCELRYFCMLAVLKPPGRTSICNRSPGNICPWQIHILLQNASSMQVRDTMQHTYYYSACH